MEKSHVDTRASRRRFKTLRRRLTSMMMLLVILVPFMQAAVSPAQTASAVVGLEPEYSNSTSEGTKPSYAWANAKDKTVLNHTGGLSTDSSAESHWNINTSQMDYKSEDTYIKYGNDAGNPNYQIRKYATESATPGLYNVKLDVRGNTQNNIKPVDIVLVVDMSGSMNPENNDYGSNRAQSVKTGVDNFMDYITEQGLGDYVRVGLVGFSSPAEDDDQYYACGDAGFITVDPGRLSTPKQISDIHTALNRDFGGGTYTQLGLIKGQEMLEDDKSDNRKMMILLTDGEPTYSQKVSTSEYVGNDLFALTFGNGTDGRGSSSWVHSYYDDTDNGTEQYQIYHRRTGRVEERTEKLPGNLIESTWPATIGQAKLAQEKGDEIHTLGIQIDDDKKGTIKHNLSLIASPGFYQYAADADAIETYLKNQAKDVVNSLNTVVDGHINDPLGSQFDYADKTVVVSSVGDNAVTDKPTATINGGVLSVNGLNVGKNQEVEITYQVYLKTEDPDFKPDYWYQMNGKTTFQPRGDDPNTVVEFGVPSAKAPAVDVPVQKIWHTLKDADTPNTLPDELSVTIKRIKHTDLKDIVDKDWAERLSLKKGDNWKGTISAPAYDNSGNAFTYFVSDEGKSGYTDPDSYILSSTGTGTEKDPVIATNQQYGFQFVKKDSKTDQDIKDPSMEFSLTSYSDSSFQGVSPVAALHQTKPHALAPGYYGIKEKTAPKGYVLDDTEYYFQLTSDGKWNYFGTNDPNSTGTSIADSQLLKAVGNGQDAFEVTGVHQNILQLTKYDKPKPTVPLTVVKTDNQGTPLAGAKFTLTGTNQASQSLTSDGNKDGQQFTQQLQANGSYTLSETQAPLGYQKSNNRVAIKIDAEGKVESVTVNGNELQSGKTLSGYTRAANDDGTSLTLTVENQPLPILPHTGGQGMVRAAAFALMMLVVAAVLAVVIWIKRRGVRIHD